MIFFIVEANVKAGLADTLQAQIEKTTARIAENEPNYALYSHFNSDRSTVTFINVASNSEALAEHFALAKDDPEGMQILNSCIEYTSMKLYGNLTPEVEAMVTAMNPNRLIPVSGTFDRVLVIRQDVTN